VQNSITGHVAVISAMQNASVVRTGSEIIMKVD